MINEEVWQCDLQHIWHPCMQMKDFEIFKPLIVSKARGSYIELTDGTKILDAVSSWWCKSLGHNHPRLKKALLDQLDKFEHVIFANTTHEIIVQLAQRLSNLMPGLDKISFASDGSCAVEMAMKMSIHARHITGETNKKKFIILENSYHGETIGAMSVSDVGLYKLPYENIIFNSYVVENIPYVNNTEDPLWQNCVEHWDAVEQQLNAYATTATALIVEPILQGAGGMKIYSQDFLQRIARWAKANNIHLIADEIMTGIGRSGKMLACEYANVKPDFICLSKGLTSGWLPLSAMITSNEIYQLFYDDYHSGKAFLHSHTYSGNALAASVALETLKIIEEENSCQRAIELGVLMRQAMQEVANATGILFNVRGIGAVVAADVKVSDPKSRFVFHVCQQAIKLGVLLRPLGNTIYWMPPLNMDFALVDELKNITIKALRSFDVSS